MTDFPSYPRGLWRSALPPAVVYDRHWARWAVGADSLTARLRAASSRFRVQLLGQRRAMPLRNVRRRISRISTGKHLVPANMVLIEECPEDNA